VERGDQLAFSQRSRNRIRFKDENLLSTLNQFQQPWKAHKRMMERKFGKTEVGTNQSHGQFPTLGAQVKFDKSSNIFRLSSFQKSRLQRQSGRLE
jgi:hypothetical protein